MMMKSDELFGDEIERLIRAKSNLFVGVYATDTLPQIALKKPFTMVLNSQTKNLPGEHWVAIWMVDEKYGSSAEFFNSFGLPTPRRCRKWLYQYQGAEWITSNTRYALESPLYKDLHTYLDSNFSPDKFRNVDIVKNFIH